MQQAFVALGGNEGDVLSAFRLALEHLQAGGEVWVEAVSPAYRTAAWLTAEALEAAKQGQAGAAAADFWNAVCEIRTVLSPRMLLSRLQGREPHQRAFLLLTYLLVSLCRLAKVLS